MFDSDTPRMAPLANEAERSFEELAHKNGWATSKRGWPDFMCFKDGDIIAVEVKPRLVNGKGMKLMTREQANVMDALQRHGIRCYVSDGAVLKPYQRDIHAAESRRRKKKR